jgi:methyl-accepting chemotaxis protein
MSKTDIKRPLWITITACGFAAVLFASVALGASSWYKQSASSDEALQREAAGDLALIETDMAAQQKSASALAVALAGEPDVAALVTANDRDSLVSRYIGSMPSVRDVGGLQNITFVNAKGEAMARIHTPDKFGDDMTGRRKTIVEALTSGKLVAGIEPGKSAVSMFASAPILKGGKTVGVVDVGTGLTNAYFKPLAARIGGEITVHVLADGKFAVQASTSNASLLSSEDIQSAFEGKQVSNEVAVGGTSYAVNAMPFKNFSGQTIGVLEIASDVSTVVEGATEALWTTIIATLVVSLLSLLGFFLFARSLAGVIARLTETMSSLAGGNLDAPIQGETRRDEVGAMARAVQVFKDNALRTKQLEHDAVQQRSHSEEERQKTAEQDRKRTEEMTQATNGLADGLKHLASGDLGFELTDRFADDFESLRADFNLAVQQLRATLSSVATATGAIDSGSQEVSQSADDLARRTEQQAASLEETAAALDQITANVANSSKRAEEARSIAIQANESARESGLVVGNAVEAMSKIETSSNQISNIIGVIDEIAFQTNLLALNAGVEAARAGDAGRGFAVVAQEVRELAQRSARAAKEIKDLIRTSASDVNGGVKLVSQTGEALKSIENYIVTINQHMDSIATSAKEQSIGLAEVNTAVNQMDQVTQQNAAMVEEANAAGATLATEAAKLKELVGRFQLDEIAHLPNRSAVRGRGVQAANVHSMPPVASAPRGMAHRIAKAFGGHRAVAAAPATDSWEEF